MTYRVITAALTARTAVHIGTGKDNDLTDALLRRDATGQAFIPGSAIAGALRALLTRLAPRFGSKPCAVLDKDREKRQKSCDCAVCRILGDVNPSDEEGSESAASRILVFNALPLGVFPSSQIRDGVGIDRWTGTAARAGAVKYDLEVLPAGATFELRLELRKVASEDEALLAAGLAEWHAGRLWLGGNIARGLGAFALNNLEYKTMCLETPEQVLTFLKDDQPWQQAQVQVGWLGGQIDSLNPISSRDQTDVVARCWVTLTGKLQAEGPLLTNDILSSVMIGFDHAPLLAQWDDWRQPVLTGAGLRGVLRSHGERLARTLASLQATGQDDFLSHCPACDPNVRDGKSKPLENCASLLEKAGKKDVENDSLCLACRLFGSTLTGSRLIVEDAPFAGDEPVLKMLDFLAIDRFTGGEKDGAKFDALALWQPAFTMRMHLENPESWELGWLWLTLRDLAEGWLTVGFGSAKGFGRVTLKDWTATFGYLTTDDAPDVAQLDISNKKKSGIYNTVSVTAATGGWTPVVQSWIKKFHDAIKKFQRPPSIRLIKDNYFGCVDKLYPLFDGGAK